MNTALGLVQPCPATTPGILPATDWRRAGRTSDGQIPLTDKWVRGQATARHFVLNLLSTPVGQRVDSDLAIIPALHNVHLRTGGGLTAFTARYHNIISQRSQTQGLDLAQRAARIRVERPEFASRIILGNTFRVGIEIDHIFQTKKGRQITSVSQRFGKMPTCIQEQHAHGRICVSYQSQQQRRFRTERGQNRQSLAKLSLRGPQQRHWVVLHRFKRTQLIVSFKNRGHALYTASERLNENN